MTFEAMDDPGHAQRFPGLQLAWQTLRAPAGSCAVLNAANEVAVAAFLDRQIRFDQIHAVNESTLSSLQVPQPQNLEDLMDIDRRGREAARAVVARLAT